MLLIDDCQVTGKAPNVFGDGASGYGAALGDLAFGESTVELQMQHFTYSAVSHNVTEIKKKMRTDKGLRTLIRQLNSQFKL